MGKLNCILHFRNVHTELFLFMQRKLYCYFFKIKTKIILTDRVKVYKMKINLFFYQIGLYFRNSKTQLHLMDNQFCRLKIHENTNKNHVFAKKKIITKIVICKSIFSIRKTG